MDFRIADTFTDRAGSPPNSGPEGGRRRPLSTCRPTLQHPSLQMHRIEQVAQDPNFWSVRVNSDVRIILHKTDASLLLSLCRPSR